MSKKSYTHKHQITGRDGYLIDQALTIAGMETPCNRQEVVGALLYAADYLESQPYPSISNAEDMRDIVRAIFPQEGTDELIAESKRSGINGVSSE